MIKLMSRTSDRNNAGPETILHYFLCRLIRENALLCKIMSKFVNTDKLLGNMQNQLECEYDQHSIYSLFSACDNWLSYRDKNIELLLRDAAVCEAVKLYKEKHIEFLNENLYNIFDIVSDYTRLEKFHSALLFHWLNPQENNSIGNKAVKCLANLIGGKEVADRYINPIVKKEHGIGCGFIDILVLDENTKHAIIIENKLNNAVDMYRQIPKYCDYISNDEGYTIDAAIYLPLDINSKPDESSWTEKDKQWKKLIRIIPAFRRDGKENLVEHFLQPLIQSGICIEDQSNLTQYSRLLKKLSKIKMDKVSMEKFLSTLMEGTNLETANSIASMMSDLPGYLAQRIIDNYGHRSEPFKHTFIYQQRDAVFERFTFHNIELKLDIWCDSNNYNFFIWAPQETESKDIAGYKSIVEFLKHYGLSCFDIFTESNPPYQAVYHLPISHNIEEILEPILQQLMEKQ